MSLWPLTAARSGSSSPPDDVFGKGTSGSTDESRPAGGAPCGRRLGQTTSVAATFPGRPAGERLPALDDSEIEAAREREFARLSEWITLRAKEIRDSREAHPESAPRREALLDEGLSDADSPEAERLKARYRQMVDEYVEEWLSENPWSGV